MFSTAHIIYLVLTIGIAVIAAIILSKKIGWSRRVLLVCCLICILSEVTRTIRFIHVNLDNNMYYLYANTIPLQLCSIQIISIFLITFSKNVKLVKNVKSFIIPTGIGGAFFALLIPVNLMTFGPWDLLTFQYMIYHSMLLGLSLYIYLTHYKELNIKSYIIANSIMLLLMYLSIFVNSALQNHGTNFFYTAGPPAENLPLLNMANGWLPYILNLIWIGLLMITLIYLPVIISDIKRLKNKKNGA